MLRVVNFSRAQPVERNLLLIINRYQQSSTSSGSNKSQSTTKNSSSTTDSSNNPKKTPPPPPSSSSSYPSRDSPGRSSGTVKAIVYGVALGLGVTILYAEYDNGPYRRKVESRLPLGPTILSGLDKIIDPVFGRQKKLTTILSENIPDVSSVADRLPGKDQVIKGVPGEQSRRGNNPIFLEEPDEVATSPPLKRK